MKRVKVQASMLVGMALFLFVALAPSRLNAQTSNAATLTVRVINARNAKGMIRSPYFGRLMGFRETRQKPRACKVRGLIRRP
jgi:uncharacterized protein (DUF2141 family)